MTTNVHRMRRIRYLSIDVPLPAPPGDPLGVYPQQVYGTGRRSVLPLLLVGVMLTALLGASCGSGKPPLVQRAGSAVSTSARVHLGGSVSIGVIDIAGYDGHEAAVFDGVVPN